MKLTRKLESKSTVLHLAVDNESYTFVFDRLKNSSVGHPRFKVYVIKNNYDYCHEYIVSQVYESLKDVALKLLDKNLKTLID